MRGGTGRYGVVAAFAAVVALAGSAPATASQTGNDLGTSTTAGSTNDTDLIGQTFVVPSAPVTDNFLHTLQINTVTRGAGNFRVYVSAVDGSGFPTGAPLFTSPQITGPLNQNRVTVYPNIVVTPGQQYAFYVDANTTLGIRSSGANPYPDGTVVFHSIAANAWDDSPQFDLAFQAFFSDGKGSTSTALNCPAQGMIGVASACTVGVTSNGAGLGTPTGTIGFSTIGGNGTTGGCAALDGAGTCNATYTPTDGGTHQVFAQYLGDATHLGSSRNLFIAVARRTTQVQGGSCSPARVTVGQTVTCTATVADVAPGAVTNPTGPLFFASSRGGTFRTSSCGLAPTGVTGRSACGAVTFEPSEPGQHEMSASYSGDATHATAGGTAGSVTVIAKAAPPTTDCKPLRKRIKALKRKFAKAGGQAAKRKAAKKLKRARSQAKAEGC